MYKILGIHHVLKLRHIFLWFCRRLILHSNIHIVLLLLIYVFPLLSLSMKDCNIHNICCYSCSIFKMLQQRTKQNGDKQATGCRVQNIGYKDAQGTWNLNSIKRSSQKQRIH